MFAENLQAASTYLHKHFYISTHFFPYKVRVLLLGIIKEGGREKSC